MVDCFMQGQMVRALWDSGSQVTIMDEQWKAAHLPDVNLRALSEILETEDTLNIVAAWANKWNRLAPQLRNT